jgi:hypothetical protein
VLPSIAVFTPGYLIKVKSFILLTFKWLQGKKDKKPKI